MRADRHRHGLHRLGRFSEDVVEEQDVGGRRWRVGTHLWRLHESGVNRIRYTYRTVVAETETLSTWRDGHCEHPARVQKKRAPLKQNVRRHLGVSRG